MKYLGIDLGTSSVKVLLVDENGLVINEASQSYPIYRPLEGFSEQNPTDWWNATKKCVKELIKGVNKEDVRAISFGGQMHGLVALDKNAEVIRNAILWNDGRTVKESEYLNDVIGKTTLVNNTGNFSFPGFTLPKILWMKNNEPELFNKISMVLLPKDYIAYKFTGIYSTDYSDATGTLLLDTENKCWSKKMVDISGLSVDKLPNLYESYDVVGKIKADVAKELGLSESTLVTAGAGDNAAAAIGTGCVKNNSCNVSLGTSGTILASTNSFIKDENMPLHFFNHANSKYMIMGCILTAASANEWWVKNILNSDYKEEVGLIKDDDLGKNNVFFAPYLSGERCPHNDVNIRGSFINLSNSTSRKNMSQAVLEGVSFALRDCFELLKKKGLSFDEITLCGGGAKNPIWAKMIANIFNVKVNFVKTEQGPGYGAAILAMVGDKRYSSVTEACENIIEISSSIEPKEEIVELYERKYQKFIKIYNAIKDI